MINTPSDNHYNNHNAANNTMSAAMAQVLLANLREQRLARRWKIFFRLIWLSLLIALFVVFTMNAKTTSSTSDRAIKPTGPQIAVVDLKGAISAETNTYNTVSTGLQSALANKDVAAVIIRANSPGGSPVYSDMLYNEIMRLRKEYPKKPIMMVAEEVCASGCYYIAAATNKIYASQASIIGSIGVIYTGFGLTGLMQKLGVDSRLLISGRNKAMGYPFIAENKEQTAMQQQMLDEVHEQFITAVKKGRGSRLKLTTKDLFSGRYWIGADALQIGLIDGISSVSELARQQFNSTNLVDYTPTTSAIDKLSKKLGLSTSVGGLLTQGKDALINASDATTFGAYR